MIVELIMMAAGFALGFLMREILFERERKQRAREAFDNEITEEIKRREEEEKNAFGTLLAYNIDMVYGGRGLEEE